MMLAGSCWAFSSTGAMEGINALVTGDLISLSEEELVDCDTTNDGCDGGYMDYAFEWVINNGGIDSEKDYPYTSSDGVSGTCNTTKVLRTWLYCFLNNGSLTQLLWSCYIRRRRRWLVSMAMKMLMNQTVLSSVQ